MLTVRQLISLPELNSISCAAAESLLDTPVSGCSVMETAESIRWVKKQELVITSGIMFQNDEPLQRRVVVELKECGCSALGIKTREFLKEIPQAMIDEAEKQQLPLLDIPFYYSFSQISKSVYYHLFQQSLSDAQSEDIFIEGLSALFFHHQGLDEMVKKIFADIGYTVLITDFQYNIISLYTSDEYSSVFQKGINTRLEPVWNSNFFTGSGKNDSSIFRYCNFNIDDSPYRFLVCPIPDYHGFICIPIDQGKLEPWLQKLIQKSSPIIALELARGDNVRQQSSHDFFLDFLREDTQKGEMEIIKLCNIYGFPYQYQRVCIIFQTNHTKSSYAKEKMKTSFSQLIAREWGDTVLSYLCAGTNITAAFLLFKNNTSPIQAQKAAYRSASLFTEQCQADQIYISAGISRCHKGVSTIRTAFSESMEALEMRRKIKNREQVFQYEDAWVYHVLSRLSRDELIDICRNRIRILVDYDNKNHTDLTETLKEYYDSHFNISTASEKLFIHRNTMRQRLEKISQLLFVSADLSDCGYSLYLELSAWELLKNLEKGDSRITND
ncbi:PucR family transcriptional regulator [Lachnoclostridium edouardi]|uniref:PucR family transcriptional regulator n=1 Tax=Lachnoclostridium edouardi TaxID=1926283 RepID=UPI000C7D7674|nr:PucR family transcriptional regulator [Lachnoclostridium edouardi]